MVFDHSNLALVPYIINIHNIINNNKFNNIYLYVYAMYILYIYNIYLGISF